MQDLPLYYKDNVGWVLDVPRAPTPEQVKFLRSWVRETKILNHITGMTKHLEAQQQLKVVKDLIDGKIQFNVLGDNMDGTGDIRLFEAPRPRERIYSIPQGPIRSK